MRHVQEFAHPRRREHVPVRQVRERPGLPAFKITRIDSNTIYGRAVSLAVNDPDGYHLATAKSVRLIPWEISPY